MRRIILVATVAVAALLPSAAAAQSCTANNVGQFTYTNCSDGSSYTTNHIGQFSYTSGADGSSATTSHIGNSAYTTYSDGTSATTQNIGNNSFTSYSDGTSATTQRVGNNAYTSYSDGTMVNTTRVGGSVTSTTSAPATAPATAPPPAASAPYGATVIVGGVSYSLPAGLLVKGSGAAIYVILNGARWVFPDWQTFLAYGGAPDLHDVLVLRDGDLGQIPVGPIVPPRR